jgi:predicted membrane channel-forming protein YqfA (hemolysin III family)
MPIMNHTINKIHLEKNKYSGIYYSSSQYDSKDDQTTDKTHSTTCSELISSILLILFYITNSITEFLVSKDFFFPNVPSPKLILPLFDFLLGVVAFYALMFLHGNLETTSFKFVKILKIVSSILILFLLLCTIASFMYHASPLSFIGCYVSISLLVLTIISMIIIVVVSRNWDKKE